MAEYDMRGKVGIVTGANAGIGKRVALGMARAGATVIMACRSAERGEAARQEVIAGSGNADVHLLQVDLSSQAAIRAAVAEFEARFDRLDVLINNAANFDHRLKAPVLTAEGIETVFATNHLGPFLLTNLLLPRLKASALARVINVASKGLITYPRLSIEFDNLNGQRKFSMQHAYYHSKLAQVMFTYDLAERLAGSGVTANVIRVPVVRLDEGRFDHIPGWMQAIYRLKMRLAAISPEEMAETYLYLAASPEAAALTGQYIDENRKPVKSSPSSYDRAVWHRLWNVSAQLTGLGETIPAGEAVPA
jgi:NAD(P)-dependent dehydrogenase (short-subunit alcohol dehydrogenase family)